MNLHPSSKAVKNVAPNIELLHKVDAWAARSLELAVWADRRLSNRRDCYGGYWSERTTDGWKTNPTTRKNPLTRDTFVQHFSAVTTRHVVGLHAISLSNSCLWVALDLDQHGDDQRRAEANFGAAQHWLGVLAFLGFHPMLIDSNGRGGLHLWIFFSSPIPAETAFAFPRWLVRNYASLGLDNPPECFPKQSRIESGKYGSWLRCPGRHHTRTHWARVWSGDNWLEGDDAIDSLRSLNGDDPRLIPNELTAPRITACWWAARRHSRRPRNPVEARASAYLNRLPKGLHVGEHRDDVGFSFARFLIHQLGMMDGEALDWMTRWNQSNADAKSMEDLTRLIANAHKYGAHR
jgi:hypothetical protein